jgi:hypothetical protein
MRCRPPPQPQTRLSGSMICSIFGYLLEKDRRDGRFQILER